jgi:hypothetical protein
MEVVTKEKIYSIVKEEISNDLYDKLLQKKAIKTANGDPVKAQNYYVEYRLEQLETYIGKVTQDTNQNRNVSKNAAESLLREQYEIKREERELLRVDWLEDEQFSRAKEKPQFDFYIFSGLSTFTALLWWWVI